jgi:hypothetical protein
MKLACIFNFDFQEEQLHTHRRTVFFARSIIKTVRSLRTLFLAEKVVPPKTSVVGPE